MLILGTGCPSQQRGCDCTQQRCTAYMLLKGLDIVENNERTLTHIVHMRATTPLRAWQRVMRRVHNTLH